jgi:hypothetical protein
MSKNIVEQLFSRLKDIVPEAGAEIDRMAGLGAAELAAALFRGDPFVMYGPNQRSAKVEQEQSLFGHHGPSAEHEKNQEQQEPGKDMTHER